MSLNLRLIPKPFNPENPIPNNPFYSDPSLYSVGPWFPFIVGTGFTFNYQTSTINATGGGGVPSATPILEGIVYGCTTAAVAALGCNALLANTGTENSALGVSALCSNTTGTCNIGIGYQALSANTDCSGSIAIGAYSLLSSNGRRNVAIGSNAGCDITSGCENIVLGHRAGQSISTGDSNTLIGTCSGSALTTETGNVVLGAYDGSLIAGSNNHVVIADNDNNNILQVKAIWNENGALDPGGLGNYGAIGEVLTSQGPAGVPVWTTPGAGGAATPTALGTIKGCTISGIAALGCNALLANTGSLNVAVGDSALVVNSSGSYNTAVGDNNLNSITTGNFNVGLGYLSGSALTNEDGNVVIGSVTGEAGCDNHIFLANGAGSVIGLRVNEAGAWSPYNTGGNLNTPAYGTAGQVLVSCGPGGSPQWATAPAGAAATPIALGTVYGCTVANCTSLGLNALAANTGPGNTAVGRSALTTNSTGCFNTALGYFAGCNITSGRCNTLLGANAGLCISTGRSNIGVGANALGGGVTTGNANVAVGLSAGLSITSGFGNVIVGCNSGSTITSGARNTIIGNSAGTALDTGTYNTMIGAGSGNFLTTESYNVVIGTADGSQITGLDCHIVLSNGNQQVAAIWNNCHALAPGGTANYGTVGQVLTSQGPTAPPIWSAGGGGGGGTVTSVAGTAPIAITGVATVTPTVCISPASTTACGAVQLFDGVNNTSTSLALTANQGKLLQDQITALANASNLVLAGTLDGSTGLVASVTSAGTAAGYAIGSAIPAASATTVDTYVIVTEPGTVTPPGGAATAATRGDWFLVSETAPTVYAWEFLNVGFDAPAATTTVAGVACLSTNALAQAGTDTTTALTPASAASAFIPFSCATAKGDLIASTAASTVTALTVGADGQVLTADSTCATGLKWAAAGGGGSGIPTTCITGKGALVTGTAANTPVGLAVGGNGSILTACAACANGIFWNTSTAATPTVRGFVFGVSDQGGSSNYNTALGFQALNTANAVGSAACYNTAIGYSAASNLMAGGCCNAVVGTYAMTTATTASRNTVVGNGAAATLTTGVNNTVIGAGAQTAAATSSNTVTLGNGSIGVIRAQVQTITSLSDARDKTNITALPIGLEFINSLNPVKFTWQMREPNEVKDGTEEAGFIAQDLQAAQEAANAPYLDLVYDDNPDRLEASPGKLLPVLVRAIQELSAKNNELEQRLSQLESNP